jgi:hypothetical protein
VPGAFFFVKGVVGAGFFSPLVSVLFSLLFSPDPVFVSVYWHCPCAGRQSLSLLLQRK